MKRVAIADTAFATLIDGVKNSLSKEIYRPELSYIKLVVKKDEITAYWRCWDARKQSTRCNWGKVKLV